MEASSKTWPPPSLPCRFSALPLHKNPPNPNPFFSLQNHRRRSQIPKPPPPQSNGRFTELPFDVLSRVAAAFDIPDLWAASTVCRTWREALRDLREAMVLLRWGKRFKHGSGVRADAKRALEAFLKGAERGSAAAMVDAGLMCWEMGRKEEGKRFYARAAALGHPAGQCNLGICFLECEGFLDFFFFFGFVEFEFFYLDLEFEMLCGDASHKDTSNLRVSAKMATFRDGNERFC